MSENRIKLNAYGRRVLIERVRGEWIACYLGTEGKKRSADDIVIPASLEKSQLSTWIADLLHECASEKNPKVTVLD